jgi:hypothetical protein
VGLTGEALDRAVPSLTNGQAIAALKRLRATGLVSYSEEHGAAFVADMGQAMPHAWSDRNVKGLVAALRDLVASNAIPEAWRGPIFSAHLEAMRINGFSPDDLSALEKQHDPCDGPSMAHPMAPRSTRDQKPENQNQNQIDPVARSPRELLAVEALSKTKFRTKGDAEPRTIADLLPGKLEALVAAIGGPAFDRVDLEAQIAKSGAWTIGNEARAKSAKGLPRFLVNWLNRAQESVPMPAPSKPRQSLLEALAGDA